MAYIATKATYIGEEEVKDENGKPAVDTNGKPIKRIITDADDIVFEAGEVIVLVEKINDGKHFDLEIEDKGSTYFAPTQIKIGDGIHSFGELNWLQTIDDFRVKSIIDKQIATYKTNVDKIYETFTNGVNAKIGEQNAIINNFVNYQSKEILKEIVNNNYFSISSNGVLSAFSGTEVPTVNNLKSFSIGNYNTFYNKATEQMGRYCAVFGNNHNIFGSNNYSFGYNNSINGAYILAHGFQNVINTSKDNKWTVCFGYDNQINDSDSSIVIGKENIVEHDNSVVIGTNNRTKSTESFIFGSFNDAGHRGVVFGHNSTAGTNSLAAGQFCNFHKNLEDIGNCTTCLGAGCYTKGGNSFACGQATEALMNNSFACGIYNDGNNKTFSVGNGIDGERSNIFDIDTSGKATFYGDLEVKKSFNCGNGNQIDENVEGAFACGKYNIGINKIFSIGNGKNDGTLDSTYSNAFDIDTSGKATFYGDLEIKGEIFNKDIYVLSTDNNEITVTKNTSKNIFLKSSPQQYQLHFLFEQNKSYMLGIFYESDDYNSVNLGEFGPGKNSLNNYAICTIGDFSSSIYTIVFANKEMDKINKIRVEFYEIPE